MKKHESAERAAVPKKRGAAMQNRILKYDVLQAPDVDSMVRLLASAFSASEPPAVAMQLSYDDLAHFVRLLAAHAVENGLTVIARDSDNELAGVVLTDDFGTPPPINRQLISKKFLPILAMLETLDKQYRHGRTIVPSKYLHLFMLAVHARFAGQGVAQKLVENCLLNGRKKGFSCAVTEATGVISQRVFRKVGFEERYRVSYRDYRYCGETVFAAIVGHDAALLMEKTLG